MITLGATCDNPVIFQSPQFGKVKHAFVSFEMVILAKKWGVNWLYKHFSKV